MWSLHCLFLSEFIRKPPKKEISTRHVRCHLKNESNSKEREKIWRLFIASRQLYFLSYSDIFWVFFFFFIWLALLREGVRDNIRLCKSCQGQSAIHKNGHSSHSRFVSLWCVEYILSKRKVQCVKLINLLKSMISTNQEIVLARLPIGISFSDLTFGHFKTLWFDFDITFSIVSSQRCKHQFISSILIRCLVYWTP